MHRTQLYLDDTLWNELHARARQGKTTISHLVREAMRERYLGGPHERSKAMRDFVGIRAEDESAADSTGYVRGLRSGRRLERLGEE